MLPIKARGVYIKSEAAEDPRSMARIERMMPFIEYPGEVEYIDDEAWHRLVCDANLNQIPDRGDGRHGADGDRVEPVVIFNQFLYHHTESERRARRERYPELFRISQYAGYGGWDWRSSGDPEYRQRTGMICQSGFAMNSVWGCHFRCAYCNLGRVANIYVNLEDWIGNIEEGLEGLDDDPRQTLFQWDNGTDIVCYEPEYGGTKLLIDLFARQPDRYLELYVGKSSHVDYFLGYDHRGHTTCCWSLSTQTQWQQAERGTASMDGRLEAARKCQEAGYSVRVRLSPIIPIVGWQDDIQAMIRRMFEEIVPEVLTIEPLRFHTYEQLRENFRPGLLDPEFLESMLTIPDDVPAWQKSGFPTEMRLKVYRTVLEEVAAVSPKTPVAMCREQREVWDALSDDFGRMGQHPDDFVCNCGTYSAGADPRLVTCAS